MSQASHWLAWSFALPASSRQILQGDQWVLMAVHSATWTQLGFMDVTHQLTSPNVSPLCMSDLAPRVGMTSVLMSAIGLPVCLSRAHQPASPPASCLASKSHSSVKRLRKMSMKGSFCSQILSGLCSATSKSCCL